MASRPIKGLIVTTDGRVLDTVFQTLEDFQKAVDGYIELIRLQRYAMYVNEDGLLRGLPVNPISVLCGFRVVGNVALVGHAVNGKVTQLSTAIINEISEIFANE